MIQITNNDEIVTFDEDDDDDRDSDGHNDALLKYQAWHAFHGSK